MFDIIYSIIYIYNKRQNKDTTNKYLIPNGTYLKDKKGQLPFFTIFI
jgi:hypothetical protein